ncbi:MAG: hypothetical protein AB7T63_06860 [Planctomycetota bacterium]
MTDTLAPTLRRPPTFLAWTLYVLSVPERVLRMVASTLGHLLRPLLLVVPAPIRRGRFYRLAVERQVRMLTDDVGQARLFPGQPALDAALAKRLAVGGAVDNVLMVALHASPLWILLAASDVSEGAAKFVEDLGAELEAKGYVAEGSRLSGVDRVLSGMSRLSGRLAESLDAPPLEMAALRKNLADVRSELEDVGGAALEQLPDLDRFAREVRDLARHDEASLLETVGTLAVGTWTKAGRVVGAGVAGVASGLSILGRRAWNDVVGDWFDSLERLRRRGVRGALRTFLRPQGRSARVLFDPRFVTLTERALTAGRYGRAAWRLSS